MNPVNELVVSPPKYISKFETSPLNSKLLAVLVLPEFDIRKIPVD